MLINEDFDAYVRFFYVMTNIFLLKGIKLKRITPENYITSAIVNSIKHRNRLPQPDMFSFYLRPTSRHEVSSVIDSFKITSPGFDDITIEIIKAYIEEVSLFIK